MALTSALQTSLSIIKLYKPCGFSCMRMPLCAPQTPHSHTRTHSHTVCHLQSHVSAVTYNHTMLLSLTITHCCCHLQSYNHTFLLSLTITHCCCHLQSHIAAVTYNYTMLLSLTITHCCHLACPAPPPPPPPTCQMAHVCANKRKLNAPAYPLTCSPGPCAKWYTTLGPSSARQTACPWPTC